MEKEKLIIKNFGPIKDVELELGRFNVLIGEQATGKSTIAKVLAVCRYFSYLIDNSELQPDPFYEGLIRWGLFEAVRSDTYIKYECSHYSFTAQLIVSHEEAIENPETGEPDVLEVERFKIELNPKSVEFNTLISELNKLRPSPFQQITMDYQFRIPVSFYQNEVASVMDNPFYIPTERGLQSIFSLGKNSIQNISDSLFNQFARLDQITRPFKEETSIEPLDIVYKNENGKGFTKKINENEYYSLANGASGFQSTIPIVLLVKYYTEIKRKKKTFIIEEPELNLFPVAQNKLIQYLVEKTMSYGNSILLTTHSPYILTSLNNLMYAYQVGQKHKEKINEVIEEKYWINPVEVSAYLLRYDDDVKGIVQENILDKEGLIKAEKIDNVSTILNTDFNAIMDIELNIQK